jgi:predicted esterase
VIERNIPVTTHGRYLVGETATPQPPLLVGCHGYAEAAEHEFERINSIPGAERWLRVSVQGLHRFYRGRSSDVVASWMTSQDRLLAIADNCAYVSRVVESVAAEWEASPILVFNGFSQGVGMAFRAAAASSLHVRAVIACGGDVPPELDSTSLARIGAVLIGRGTRDEWYSEEKLSSDQKRLSDAGVRVQVVRFDAGHEWTQAFRQAAGEFLTYTQTS